MSPLRHLFPSFERPVARQRYVQLQPPRRGYGGIGTVLAGSLLFGGFFLLLPQMPQSTTTPPGFLVAAPVTPPAGRAKPVETAAAAAGQADEDVPAVKLSILCGDRPTARRICAEAKAAKEAQLATALARVGDKAEAKKKTNTAAKAAPAVRAEAGEAEAELANAARRQTPKHTRLADDAASERLVHVYDHIAPDGRRVPVYRRPDGGYEFGPIEEAPPRQERRADARPPGFRGVLGFQ